jgi:predicted transcriptional regulator
MELVNVCDRAALEAFETVKRLVRRGVLSMDSKEATAAFEVAYQELQIGLFQQAEELEKQYAGGRNGGCYA